MCGALCASAGPDQRSRPGVLVLSGGRVVLGIGMKRTPVRRSQVPIVVGGHSRAALRRAARLGDAWYSSGLDTASFARTGRGGEGAQPRAPA